LDFFSTDSHSIPLFSFASTFSFSFLVNHSLHRSILKIWTFPFLSTFYLTLKHFLFTLAWSNHMFKPTPFTICFKIKCLYIFLTSWSVWFSKSLVQLLDLTRPPKYFSSTHLLCIYTLLS
jgi:hypothetical protein